MFTKTTLRLGLTGLLTMGLAACSGKSDNNNQPLSGAAPATETANTAAGYTPGTAASTARVSGPASVTVAAGTDMAMFPELGADVALLSSIDHVVTTTAGNVELYNAGNNLEMALSKDAAGKWSVVHSASAFSADSVVMTDGAADQDQRSSSMVFTMKSCVAQKAQDQGQTPAPAQGKDQGKDQTPAPAPSAAGRY